MSYFTSSGLLSLGLVFTLLSCAAEPPQRLNLKKASGNSNPAKNEGDATAGGGSEWDPNESSGEISSPDPDPIVEKPNTGTPDTKEDPKPMDPVLEPVPKPLNETGGSDNNDAVPIPMPGDDVGAEIDLYKAPRMIMSENTKECLDLDGNTNRNGEVIQGRPCAGTTGQMIEIKKAGGDLVTLNFLASKGCWRLKGDSTEKRTILEQWKCDGLQSQKWKLQKISGNSYSIRPAGASAQRCVDMDTNGPKVRSTLQIYDCLNNPQQTWTLLRKDKNFVPKAQPVLSLDDMCHHKIRVYENDTSAAGKLVYETLGGRLMDRVPEVAKEVCRVLYKKPEDVIANINYMTVYVEPNLEGGRAAIAKPEGYKDSSMKFSAKHFQEKKNAGYDIAKFLKGVMAFELTHVFQYPLNAKASAKLKVLQDALAYAVRVKTNYADVSWKRVKSGNWDQGGLQTGLFLVYLDGKYPGFLMKFNSLLNKSLDESIIQTATGMSIDELWKAYLADASCSASNLICGR